MIHHIQRSYLIPLSLIVLVFAGCGSSHYESQFEATVQDLRNKTGFQDIADVTVTDLPGTEITIRLPKILVNEEAGAFDAESPDPGDNTKPLSAERLKPLGLELPGHVRTYEAFVKTEKSAEPLGVYCILASVPKKQITGEILRQEILAKFEARKDEKAHRNDPIEWEEVQIRTPEGSQETWWKLNAKMRDQRFHYYEWEKGPTEGTVKSLALPAYYDIYLHEGDRAHVLVAWRTPQEAAAAKNLPELFEASVGTVKFEKPAEDETEN